MSESVASKKSKPSKLTAITATVGNAATVKFSEATLVSIDYDEDDVNIVRFNCVQSCFLAASQMNKERFLYCMLTRITDRALLVLLKALDCRKEKIRVYDMAYQTTNHVRDKNLIDHNRSLKLTYLEETARADLEWYEGLKESKQLEIFFDLVRLGGGALARNIFYKALHVYCHRQKHVEVKHASLQKSDDHALKNIVPAYYVQNVDNAKKKWDETLKKYRAQLERVQQQAKSQQFLIDRVQVLPVWIVKRIFGFIDQKSLQKLKSVNDYWAYVIDDMAKERAVRQYIQKTVAKIQNDMDPDDVKVIAARNKLPKMSALSKRLQKLARRGATHPKLSTFTDAAADDVFQKSLVTDAICNTKEARYIMPADKLRPFPRKIPVDGSLHVSFPKITGLPTASTSTSSEEVSSDSVVYAITSLD